MKILVSSKALAEQLAGINFKEESIMLLEFGTSLNSGTRWSFVLHGTKGGSVQLIVESNEEVPQCIDQTKIRWDFIYDTLSKISDQPVILEIEKTAVKVILQY